MEVRVTPEEIQYELLKYSHYIVEGRILEQSAQYLSNPDGTKKTKYGTVASNALITEYKVQIDKAFKGEPQSDTITVRLIQRVKKKYTYNVIHEENSTRVEMGEELPFDPKDENIFSYPVGEPCILFLSNAVTQTEFGLEHEIMPTYLQESYFEKTETEGIYENSGGITVNVATLSEEIKKAK